MVEVHLMREERPAAVFVGNLAKLAEELERGVLPRRHPIDLTLSIAAVVAHVVGPLIARTGQCR